MIVADTGAIIALADADDRHHAGLRDLYEADPDRWLLPWATLPEIDYLLATRVGTDVQRAFMHDVAAGAFTIAWGTDRDLNRARDLCDRYADLQLGLVDSVVIGIAERLGATAIATLDLRHFAAVSIAGGPRLFPRDL